MLKTTGKQYYYDFTSLYPSQMVKDLPYGKPVKISADEIKKLGENFFGFIRVKCTTIDKKALPLHGYKDSEKGFKLTFPIFNQKELTLFSGEYHEGVKSGIYQYEILDGMQFQKATYMKDCILECFKNKSEAKSNGDKALAQVYKIIANSSYGFFALRTKDRDGVSIESKDESDWLTALAENRLKDVRETDNYITTYASKDLDCKDINVGVSSAISSYSRCRLWNLMKDIRKLGFIVYYCDTDSVICNMDLSKFPKMMNEYMWDGTGDELGSLKNEADELYSSQEEIEKQKKIDGGHIYFEILRLCGLKFYSLQKADKSINKCKGYSGKLTPQDFDNCIDCYYNKQEPSKITFNLFKANGITQKQTQFCSPISNVLSENKFCNINVKKVMKSFNVVYTKGVVNDETGIVSPLAA
jgi:hypothetical protein